MCCGVREQNHYSRTSGDTELTAAGDWPLLPDSSDWIHAKSYTIHNREGEQLDCMVLQLSL